MLSHLLRSQHATKEQISRELERTREALRHAAPAPGR